MANKSLIDMRDFVPEYFGNNREFQVFLRVANIVFSVIKSDTDNFIPNLLNPLKCKARLLPLLSNYVGWDYNPRERVFTNRWITKLYPLLVRNRGNEIGITLALALSICLMGDPEELIYEKSFSMEMDETVDKYGRKISTLRIYMHIQTYLPILKDLLEVVRPAGMLIEFIPSQSISSSETVSLTDEYSITKYDYRTGKLLSINDVDVYVQNSWEVLIDEHAIKHYRWKHLEDFVWGRVETTNSTNSKEITELTLNITKNDLFNDLLFTLNCVPHYSFNAQDAVIKKNEKEDTVTTHTLIYKDDDSTNYYAPKLIVSVCNDDISIVALMYTDDLDTIKNMEKLIYNTFSKNVIITRKPLKVISDYTWGYLEDTGIEPYSAIPGLAPYDVENKGNISAPFWSTTGIHLVDGRFYDKYGNDINRYVDSKTGKILYGDGVWNKEYIKETRIFKIDDATGEEVYTGMYFDVSEPAKVLNTYYKLLDDGIFSGFFLSKDTFEIYNSSTATCDFKLIEDIMTIKGIPTLVWKVVDCKTNVKYNWHVDMISRKFIRDNDGIELKSLEKLPFSETTYIGKKAFLMRIIEEDNIKQLLATKYFVNVYGDIVDPAGNIILSKKDRYKVSDSTMIGFSEVHNEQKELSTYDGTAILQREWSFMKDDHIQDIHGKNLINDFEEYERIEDPRYKFEYKIFDIGNPIREYTGTELIRFVSNEELKNIRCIDGYLRIPLFVTSFDSENASGNLKIKMNLPPNFTLGDVFKNMNIRYENSLPNDELNPKWDIFVDWVANVENKSLFNLNDLENPIHFIKKGTIEPRTLHWTGRTIKITPKMYDGTTKIYMEGDIEN